MKKSKGKRIALKSVRRPAGLAKKEALSERDPEMVFLGEIDDTTFDDALMGSVGLQGGGHAALYNHEKCVECLMTANNWNHETAIEWMDFNVTGAYVGPRGPVFFYPHADDE